MAYEINGWSKYVQRDNWRDGCHGAASCYGGNERFSGDTALDAVEAFCDFIGADIDNDAELNACEEAGRVDVSIMENADGYAATDYEIQKWKNGEIELWYAVYTGYVEFVSRQAAAI